MKNKLVIKIGGAFLDAETNAHKLFAVLKEMQQYFEVTLVHGGGNSVEQLLKALGLKSEKIAGLRVTPNDQIGYVAGALSGTANKQLCALAKQSGLKNVGLSLSDGNMTQCKQMDPKLGAVGTATGVNSDLLSRLHAGQYLPIISSIGSDDKGQLYNVNADQAATVVAQILNADLLLLSDVDGVLDINMKLIPQLDSATSEKLVAQGVIRDGMIVKVEAAQRAADTLQKPVTIASWKHPETLLTLKQDSAHLGTKVLPQAQQD